jgi:hypothetical protein
VEINLLRRKLLGMNDPKRIKLVVANEAVDHLALLRPEAKATIASLLQDQMIEHPRSICTAYRKQGPQIPLELKRELGIRANGFLSYEAYDELSESGKKKPLVAHELTLLRATFSLMRHNSAQQEREFRNRFGKCFVGFVYDIIETDCAACATLEGKIVRAKDAHQLPPPDCTCLTANYSLRPKVDFLADLD